MDKLNDCYFYFYSTCTKGKKCPFRHCDLALGSEVVCELWRAGRCKDFNCPFRHMEPNIKRTLIPCWFESQPGGCRKPHCVFQHSKPRLSLSDVQPGQDLILPIGSSANINSQNSNDLAQINKPQSAEIKALQKSEINLSIERDEESDDPETTIEENETKSNLDNKVKVKTLEEIRMEKVLGSLHDEPTLEVSQKSEETNFLITPQPQLKRPVNSNASNNNIKVVASPFKQAEKEESLFLVKTLDQIRKERSEQDDSQDDTAKPTFKENQAPNSLKRVSEMNEANTNSNTRPVKIRRTRASTETSQLIEKPNEEVDFQQCNVSITGNNTINVSNVTEHTNETIDSLDDEFDIDNLDANDADLDVSSEDELMREIDQVINS